MSDQSKPQWRDLGLTYEEAAHGVQTAVKFEMVQRGEPGADETGATSPKHLRTGLNMSKAEHGALAKLLIDKGVITDAEYREELRLATNNELAMYESHYPWVKFR